MKDWNGKDVESIVSKGGVVALVNPYDNLIRTGISPWPPAEIVQKLYSSIQRSAFQGSDYETCRSYLGYYCDLQSINSEDAITWSLFGTLSHTTIDTQSKWLTQLISSIDLPKVSCESPQITLWRRIPHPDTLALGGPEIDVCITTENAVLLCEAKWLSKTGSKQGKMKDKNQIQLRGEFLKAYGRAVYPNCSEFIVLGIGLSKGTIEDNTPGGVDFREVTWENLCNNRFHPLLDEILRYMQWKSHYSIIKPNVRLK